MSRSFQDNFITIKGFEKDKLNAASKTSSPQTERSDTLLCSGLTGESVASQHGPDIDIENLAPKETLSLGTETTELATHIAAEAEKDNPTSDLPDFDSDEEEPPRYELAQWPRHLRAAEEAWPPAERDTDLQERWEKLYTIIEIILSPGSRVYRDRSRRLSLWRSQPLDPLHVAARLGLLGMMQRYISYGAIVNVLDEVF